MAFLFVKNQSYDLLSKKMIMSACSFGSSRHPPDVRAALGTQSHNGLIESVSRRIGAAHCYYSYSRLMIKVNTQNRSSLLFLARHAIRSATDDFCGKPGQGRVIVQNFFDSRGGGGKIQRPRGRRPNRGLPPWSSTTARRTTSFRSTGLLAGPSRRESLRRPWPMRSAGGRRW